MATKKEIADELSKAESMHGLYGGKNLNDIAQYNKEYTAGRLARLRASAREAHASVDSMQPQTQAEAREAQASADAMQPRAQAASDRFEALEARAQSVGAGRGLVNPDANGYKKGGRVTGYRGYGKAKKV